MEETIINPAASYSLAGICLVLLAAFGKVLLYYRADNKELTAAILKNSVASVKALSDNAVANVKLAISLDAMTRSFKQSQEELLRRLNITEEEE